MNHAEGRHMPVNLCRAMVGRRHRRPWQRQRRPEDIVESHEGDELGRRGRRRRLGQLLDIVESREGAAEGTPAMTPTALATTIQRGKLWRSWACSVQAYNMYIFITLKAQLKKWSSISTVAHPATAEARLGGGSGHRADVGMQAPCLLLEMSLQNLRWARQRRWDLWRSQRRQSAEHTMPWQS